MTTLPSGMLTFLFTDIEGSTPRWERAPHEMTKALARHDTIIQDVVASHDGVAFKNTGDGFAAVFTSPDRATAAAVEAQIRLQNDEWEGLDRLKVRMGLHIGEGVATQGDYHGRSINWAARVMDTANGDQIAVSDRLAAFLGAFELRSMGEHRLKGIGTDTIHVVFDTNLITDDRPLRSRTGITTNIPPLIHRLIGRTEEIEQIENLLDQHQAITVVGPGGVGKTHLVIELGHAVLETFTDGVVYCDLVPLNDGDALEDTVAEALGARSQPGMTLAESIIDYLSGRRVLLILDNCEHVSLSARALIQQVLGLQGPRILATSREPLSYEAEQLFGLSPLDTASDAVELFLERALERDHAFKASADDLVHIQEICERLDGIPLGIELAAAWARILSPAELVERLEDRFRVLRGGRAGGRHETLRDTVLWSYEQLAPSQAALFDRLSVFAGSFSLDAVEAVCADPDLVIERDVLDLIMALVEKSMVVSQRRAGQIRFRLLGTLRQFGQEQLDSSGDSSDYRLHHANYYGELAKAQGGQLLTEREAEVWEAIDLDWANMRAAVEDLIAIGKPHEAASLILELGWYASLSMRFEIFTWVEELFTPPTVDDHPDICSILGLRAIGAYMTVDKRSVDYAKRGLELDPKDRFGFCRQALAAESLNNVHDAKASDDLTMSWLTHLDDSSSSEGRLWAAGMRVFHICVNAPSPEAAIIAAGLRRDAASSGSASAIALAHWASGIAATFDGIDRALKEWDAGLDSARSLSQNHLLVHLIVGLELHFTASHGDLPTVVDRCLESIIHARSQHYVAGTSHLFGVIAIVLSRTNRAEIGARLLGAMTANGHKPRPNAIRALERAVGDDLDQMMLDGSLLTISDASLLAIDALSAASLELEETS